MALMRMSEKVVKNKEQKKEIMKLWRIKHVEVLQIVIGALWTVSKRLDAWLEKLEITIRMGYGRKQPC